MKGIYQVVFSQKARNDLQRILNYYSQKTSIRLVQKIRKHFLNQAEALQRFPESKPTLKWVDEDLGYEVRYTKAWSYKIIFRISHINKTVRVLTIMHDKEDPENIAHNL